jgi:hypothetical protein
MLRTAAYRYMWEKYTGISSKFLKFSPTNALKDDSYQNCTSLYKFKSLYTELHTALAIQKTTIPKI